MSLPLRLSFLGVRSQVRVTELSVFSLSTVPNLRTATSGPRTIDFGRNNGCKKREQRKKFETMGNCTVYRTV